MSTDSKKVVDVTPHPRILRVLAEIEFRPWQCIAELVDNSIDGFLQSKRDGVSLTDPTVLIAFGQETITVKDNGPGMSLESLEKAVKAGWSSQDKFGGSLGLYGVGFNIATARLGNVTEIWTTRPEDQHWHILEIDLKKLANGDSFLLETKQAPKTAGTSGTIVRVSDFRTDWKSDLRTPSWIKREVTDQLAKIYSTMLRDQDAYPLKFSLLVDNKKVESWGHCVWPADKEVYRKGDGLVSPLIEIDRVFGKKFYSKSSGDIIELNDISDAKDVTEVTERVYGWIGIQRYTDHKEFGIDVLRNGRKIEIGNKDVFNYDDETEYPIDDLRAYRGRIVGEIHLDHGYVHYTKHRFEREHSSWSQLLTALRNKEPLINRPRFGYHNQNESPLGKLFRTFRRNTPAKGQTLKSLLILQNNDEAKKWAIQFRKGITAYVDESLWNKAFEDQESTPEAAPAPEVDSGLNPNPNDIPEKPTSEGPEVGPPSTERERLSDLDLNITNLGYSGRPYTFEVYAVRNSRPNQDLLPWKSKATTKGAYEIEINLQHPTFNSSTLSPKDAILAEAAYIITQEELAVGGNPDSLGYGSILSQLRARYSTHDSLDQNSLRADISRIRERAVAKLVSKILKADEDKLMGGFDEERLARLHLQHAQGPEETSILHYLSLADVLVAFRKEPTVFFSQNCFNKAWDPGKLMQKPMLLAEHRRRIQHELEVPLSILSEFTEGDTSGQSFERSHLQFVRAAINRVQDLSTDANLH